MIIFTILFVAFFLGLLHTLEIDHLTAVINLIHTKDKTSRYEGFYWGAGHSLTIIVIGIAVMVLKYNIAHSVFQFFEGVVGIMLVLIGLVRVAKIRFRQATLSSSPNNHRLAFGVGLVHGLAGSGVVVAMAVAQTPSVPVGVSYLLCFGVGGIVGMFGITFFLGKIIRLSGWEKWNINRLISLVSALFCLAYGIFVIVQNFVV